LDFNDVVPVKPHVFERDKIEFCFNDPRECARAAGEIPDEHRLLLDVIEILSKKKNMISYRFCI